MSEPKRFNAVIRHGEIVPNWSPTGALLSADDPAIVRDLAIASAAREAGMVDEQGNFRKILGTLPITADGCVVGFGAEVWHNYYGGPPSKFRSPKPVCDSTAWESGPRFEHCYSTRSAAEAAKGGGECE